MSMLVERIATFWDRVQTSLFPALEETGLEMTEKLYQLVTILEVLRIECFVAGPSPYRPGVKAKDRRCLARAFVAKAFYGAADSKAFRERLRADAALRKVCGWMHRGQVPSEATFSRAFRDFAECGLADQVHAVLVQWWRGDDVVWHAATDSTAIPARETPVTRKKPVIDAAAPKRAPRKRGRPKKGEAPPPPEESLLVPPPKNSTREPYQASITMVPSSMLHMAMSRTSRFLICAISCPTTPWSSSRLSFCSSPEVTASEARFLSRPVAKAFMAGSSMI